MKRLGWRIGVAGILSLGVQWVIQTRAAPPRTYNLEEMVVMADRIFIGAAVEERTGRDQRGLPATFTTFTIARVLKGSPRDRIRIKQIEEPRARSGETAQWVPGVPRYRPEKDYLVFLMPDNALGFTSPVGALQGAFEIRSADGDVRTVSNGVDNANLLIGLTRDDLIRLGLSSANRAFLSRGRGPMPLEVMVKAIGLARSEQEAIRSREAAENQTAAEVDGNPAAGAERTAPREGGT